MPGGGMTSVGLARGGFVAAAVLLLHCGCGGSPPCGNLPARCADAQKDGDETDVDCGGPTCGHCMFGKNCLRDADCTNGVCAVGRCRAPAPLAFALSPPIETKLFDDKWTLGQIVTGDFNRDGKIDIAVNSYRVQVFETPAYFDNSVTLALANGDGTFASGSEASFSFGYSLSSLAVADLNGDGELDLVGSILPGTADNLPTIGERLGRVSNCGFDDLRTFTVSDDGSLAAADLNRDGHADLVIGDESMAGNLGVHINDGTGAFLPVIDIPSGGVRSDLFVIDDFDGDGFLDLVVASKSDEIRLLRGRGDGTFDPAIKYATNIVLPKNYSYERSIVSSDFNGDGLADLAVGYDDVVIFLGQQGAGLSLPQPLPLMDFAAELAAGDMDGDGNIDLLANTFAASGPDGTALCLYRGKGDGTFMAPQCRAREAVSVLWGLVDADRDGKPDPVTLPGKNAVQVSLNSSH